MPHRKAIHELPCHKQLPVASRHDLGPGNTQNLGSVRIGDLAAPYDCRLKHAAPCCGTRKSSGPKLLRLAPLEPSQAALSLYDCCTQSSSSLHAIGRD